jgi:hypothetical protein
MADAISLYELRGDSVVIHFGGETGSIDAYTFAGALIGLTQTAYAISLTVDPGHEIEIRLEAIGPGSFRARLRRYKKQYGGVFTRAVEAVFWGIVANIIYDALIKKDASPRITINTNEVIVETEGRVIIVPRAVHDATQNVKNNPDVQEGLRRTFEPLLRDTNITEFALTSRMDDPDPPVRVPRSEFPRVLAAVSIFQKDTKERTIRETARVVILKAWLNHAKRKWAFEWNGVPVSAPIADQDFLDKLERRELLLGAGDALDVEIAFKQRYDDELGVFVNEPNSFIIAKVVRPVPRSRRSGSVSRHYRRSIFCGHLRRTAGLATSTRKSTLR